MGCQFNTDCEGPISKNDNAMELTEFYIPNGHRLFAIVSKYDDFLADVERRPGYEAGDTLKLILPFLKAFGATDEGMREFSRGHLLLVPGAKEALSDVRTIMETFIISTSYEPYIDALCEALGFPKNWTYSTQVTLDRYLLKDDEKERLTSLVTEIQEMKMMEWPEKAQGLSDLSDRDQGSIQRLNQIFWGEIQEMAIGKILSDVNPIGGKEKAGAILLSLERTGNRLDEVIYVGDSITDVEAFNLVRKGGGMTISFNGNRYALRSAEVACLSPHASILAILAGAFQKNGREFFMEIVDRWGSHSLASLRIDPKLIRRLESIQSSIQSEEYPKVQRITDGNRGELIQESEAFRKRVRGVEVGSLG
jgi:energy-converting hydrogenase A subunit R